MVCPYYVVKLCVYIATSYARVFLVYKIGGGNYVCIRAFILIELQFNDVWLRKIPVVYYIE